MGSDIKALIEKLGTQDEKIEVEYIIINKKGEVISIELEDNIEEMKDFLVVLDFNKKDNYPTIKSKRKGRVSLIPN